MEFLFILFILFIYFFMARAALGSKFAFLEYKENALQSWREIAGHLFIIIRLETKCPVWCMRVARVQEFSSTELGWSGTRLACPIVKEFGGG